MGAVLMWLVVPLCVFLGFLCGIYSPIILPAFLAKYLSVAILATLDSVFGGIRAYQQGNYNSVVLLSGFLTNSLLAAGLAFIGDQLGIALYLAAVFAFGVRIFQNLAISRRDFLKKLGAPRTPGLHF